MNRFNLRVTLTALATLAMGLSTAAQAGEIETYCKLATARAEVQSEILAAPEAFGSVGDPVTGARTATVGVRKFISRGKQAELVKQLAAAECSAYRAERGLAEQLSGVEARAELKAIIAKKPLLEGALKSAEDNLATEQKMLDAQASTLADLKAAYDQRDRLRQEIAALDGRRSLIQNQLPEVDENLETLLDTSLAAQADVAELTAKITAQGGWEVSISGGARADLSGKGKQEGFVAVTASRSFGYDSSAQAAARVGGLAAQLLREQRDGAVQQLMRTRDTVAGVIAAERLTTKSLTERQAAMTASLQRLAGVNTTEGLRTQRALQVEVAHTAADLKASEARMAHLTQWATLNTAN